eukprot:1649772-Amphidinium_carterae.5
MSGPLTSVSQTYVQSFSASHSLPLTFGSSASQCCEQFEIQTIVSMEELMLVPEGLGVISFTAVIAMTVSPKLIQCRIIQSVVKW